MLTLTLKSGTNPSTNPKANPNPTYLGCVHKLSPGNPGYPPAVHKLITETGLIVYERLVRNQVRNRTTLLASRIVRLKMASS